MYGIYKNGSVIGVFTAPLTVRSNQPVFVSDSFSLKRSRERRPNQRWEISANIRPESTDANALFTEMVLKGLTESVEVLVPQNFGVISKRKTGTVPSASGSQGSSQVTVTTTAFIPQGCFIRFSNHSKIYMTTSDKNINSNTLNIYPTLRIAVSNASFNWEDNVIMNAYFDTDTTIGMAYSDGILMDLGTVKLVEAL